MGGYPFLCRRIAAGSITVDILLADASAESGLLILK
jgi:hypothetical protein